MTNFLSIMFRHFVPKERESFVRYPYEGIDSVIELPLDPHYAEAAIPFLEKRYSSITSLALEFQELNGIGP